MNSNPRKPPKKLPKYLTTGEIDALFAGIKNPRDRAMFRVTYHRGLRASEIGMLQMSDYHEIPGRPPVAQLNVTRLKGSRDGVFELTEIEHTAMRAYLRVRGAAPGPLFCSRNHRAISRRQVYDLMSKYCRLAGLPVEKSHPHALKHSCGTHVLAITHDIMATQFQLGHADLRSTLIYSAFTQEQELAVKLKDWGRKPAA
jgi:integrase/recombinase XerD